jgi:Type II CAAX prenyl endopeptidase Rce1-like
MFLKNPSLENQCDIKSHSAFLKMVWKSFLILLASDIILGLFFCGPLIYFDLFPSLKGIKFNLLNILKISLYCPIMEELIFRLPLRISKLKLIISFCILISTIVFKRLISNVYLVIFFSVILYFCLSSLLREDSRFFINIVKFFTLKFRMVFYFQALLFGFLHLTNYNLEFKYFYLFPLFIVNYIFAGCFWGYLRVKYINGIYLCIASHIFINSIYSLVLLH